MENVPHVAKRPLFTQFRPDRREPFLDAAGLGQTIVGPRQKQVPRHMPVAIMEGRIGLGVDDVHRRFAEAEPLDMPHHGSQFVQRRQGRARPTRPRFLYAVGGPQSDLERGQRVPRAVAHQQRGAHHVAFGNVPAAQRNAVPLRVVSGVHDLRPVLRDQQVPVAIGRRGLVRQFDHRLGHIGQRDVRIVEETIRGLRGGQRTAHARQRMHTPRESLRRSAMTPDQLHIPIPQPRIRTRHDQHPCRVTSHPTGTPAAPIPLRRKLTFQ